MSDSEELRAAVIDVLGTQLMTRDDVRRELGARGVDVGDVDHVGLDELDHIVQTDPAIASFGDDVAHLPSLFNGVSWTIEIDDDEVERGAVAAAPQLSPIVDVLLDDDVRVVNASGDAVGTATVGTADVNGLGIDVVTLPPVVLVSSVCTLTLNGAKQMRVDVVDTIATPTDQQCAALTAAFDLRAAPRAIVRPLDGTEVTVRTATVESLAAAMVANDRASFLESAVPPIDALVKAAGLTVQRGLVGAGDTDWASLESWLRKNRLQLDHHLTDEQAISLVVLTDEASNDPARRALALGDATVAEAAWDTWVAHGTDIAGAVASLDDEPGAGADWLRARQLLIAGSTDDALELLNRHDDYSLAQIELAGVAADRSDPATALRLLREAGVDTEVDWDAEYDPVTSQNGFGRELAEEIAPFAVMRPKAMAGRNDQCPCGSGRKYKQCHLGNELHALEHRAGWLYVKMMRFLQLTDPRLPLAIADTVVSTVESNDLRRMLRESYLPIDLALHEGGVADAFLTSKAALLPHDEASLVAAWIESTRSVYEVVRSTRDDMDVVDLATRERFTVRDTVPEEPLETGWKVIARLVPVGNDYRAYSGFLPVNDDMVDTMVAGFATRQLETVALTVGQIFQTAETQDSMQQLFEDSLDDTELSALIEQMNDEMG